MLLTFIISISPLCYLAINSFFQKPAHGWETLFRPYVLGLMWGIFSLLITILNVFGVSFSPEPLKLVLWIWVNGPGWPIFLVITVLSVRYWSNISTWTRARQIIAWLYGTGSIYMAWNGFTYDKTFEKYWIFIHPLVWVGCVSFCTCLLDISMQKDGFERIVFVFLALITTFAFGFVIVFHIHVSMYLSAALGIVLAIFGTLLTYLRAKGRVSF